MQTVIAGLYASPPERLPFAAEVEIRAFLLARKQRNLLVYNVGTVPPMRNRSGNSTASRANT
jgi:hypothetical protein